MGLSDKIFPRAKRNGLTKILGSARENRMPRTSTLREALLVLLSRHPVSPEQFVKLPDIGTFTILAHSPELLQEC